MGMVIDPSHDIHVAAEVAGALAARPPASRVPVVHRLDEAARVDALTGLPTRRVWEERLPAVLLSSGGGVWVASIRLGGTAAFARRHGSLALDERLRAVAAGWRAALRADDVLARLGGDVFAAAVHAATLATALAVVGRVRAATPPDLVCTVGVAGWERGETPARVTSRSAEALELGLDAGGSRVAVALAD